eukprot:9466582-Pyramimonas_sp.AAC.2
MLAAQKKYKMSKKAKYLYEPSFPFDGNPVKYKPRPAPTPPSLEEQLKMKKEHVSVRDHQIAEKSTRLHSLYTKSRTQARHVDDLNTRREQEQRVVDEKVDTLTEALAAKDKMIFEDQQRLACLEEKLSHSISEILLRDSELNTLTKQLADAENREDDLQRRLRNASARNIYVKAKVDNLVDRSELEAAKREKQRVYETLRKFISRRKADLATLAEEISVATVKGANQGSTIAVFEPTAGATGRSRVSIEVGAERGIRLCRGEA